MPVGQQSRVVLQQDVEDQHGVRLDARLDVRHGTGQVGAEQWEERAHALAGHTLGHEAQQTEGGRANAAIFVCECSGHLAQESGEMLLHQCWVGGEQLAEATQSTKLHGGTVVVKLGQ